MTAAAPSPSPSPSFAAPPRRVFHDQALYSVAATRQIEQAAQRRLPPHTLMQRAGWALARLALALAPHARCIWLACGPGNNGGDGLQAAAHLHQWGLPVCVSWLGGALDEAALPADARASLRIARAAGVPFLPPEGDLPALGPGDLGVDALLGIGADRPPAGLMARWLAHLHGCGADVLAADVPTGLNADTGALNWPMPAPAPGAARHTLSLLTCKPGLFTASGRDACGNVWFDDLGISPDAACDLACDTACDAARAAPAADSANSANSANSASSAAAPSPPPAAWLAAAPAPAPARPHASHKGSRGDVAIVGGENAPARGSAMPGAAWLAASAALHAGAGRVFVSPLLPEGQNWPLLPALPQPEFMLRRLADLPWAQLSVACGCGGGQAVQAALPLVIERAARLVLDADALNALAARADCQQAVRQRRARGQPTVLTPHPLEAARLLGLPDAAAVQQNRLAAAAELADRYQAAIVLKGSGSVIATPGQTPRINPSGNARLASGGTGDVLAGLIAARLASAPPQAALVDAAFDVAFEAATRAAWQHGAAADTWPATAPTLTASALARRLPAE